MNNGVESLLKANLGNMETTKPKDMPAIHHAIEHWTTRMIYGRVLQRFLELKAGLIGLGPTGCHHRS